ncbi:MAG TPA: M13 family metallopeptidase [Vicinamibacterales bacterium]|nr:M13 family metallopeptidase [Vicinamibacterales bacterium]
MRKPDPALVVRSAVLAAVTLMGLATAACRPAASDEGAPAATPVADASTSTASPHGLDVAAIDRSVNPGDDFYKFANGAWLEKTEIPADRSTWGPSEAMTEEAARRTRELLEEAGRASPPAGSVRQQAADYYVSYMDDAGIEAAGLAPLKPILDRFAAIDSHAALSRALGEELRADVDALNNTNFRTDRLFGVWVTAALDDPATSRPYLLQGGLDLPDREYYLAASERMAGVRKEYAGHVSRTLRLAGTADPDAAAAAIVALETKIARAHATRAESLDVLKANNPWRRAEFPQKAPGLDWDAFLSGARLEQAPVIIVWHPAAVRGLSALVRSEPLASWKHWLTFHAIDRNAAVLPKAFVEERFAFHGRVLNGTPQLAERWKRGIAATSAALPEAVGQVYVARYFPPETKAQMQAMVKNLIAAFGARIDRLEWMSPATKVKARQKLATLRVGVGYPDSWVDYSRLPIVKGDAFGNRQRAERFEYERQLAKLGRPVDKGEWWMSPQTVNALNLPLQNALNFPAAILAPPYFDAAAPAATNYGAIGAIIGHEITHSFDDQGAMFDADGRLANWWTKEDLEHFRTAGGRLAAQYDAYAPFPDLHVNGKQTLSENIADVAGLATAYDGWRASLGETAAPEMAGFTGPQQFFLAYAQGWLIKWREPALRQALITDGHAPGEYRAASVRNLDAWYDAFDVIASRRLYLRPDDRVRVW